MVDILLLQTISIVIASAGVFVAAIYYILQIRHQTKMRQTDMVMRLYATFEATEFQKVYQDGAKFWLSRVGWEPSEVAERIVHEK